MISASMPRSFSSAMIRKGPYPAFGFRRDKGARKALIALPARGRELAQDLLREILRAAAPRKPRRELFAAVFASREKTESL